jgi:WD40 repeat protein
VWKAGAEGAVEFNHGGSISYAEFGRDETLFVTAGADRVAKVWRVRDGSAVGKPMEHRGPVTYAGFSGDGRFLATTGADQAARVWVVETGEPITPWLMHQDVVLHAAFKPDGTGVATAARDGTARLWNVLQPEARSPATLKSVAETLAGQIQGSQGGLKPVAPRSYEQGWQYLRTAYPDEFGVPRSK